LRDADETRRQLGASGGADCAVADGWMAPAGAELLGVTGRHLEPRQHHADADERDARAALAGDPEAFEPLVHRYGREVAARMWRFSRDPRTRDELVQDVFVEAYLSLGTYRPGRPFVNWLRQIATRVGYRHWARLERQARQVRLEDGPAAPAAPAGGEAAPAERAAALLDSLLARLAPADRLVLTLAHLDGCDLREVAERTGWSRAVVAMRAYRARRKLRRIIERENLLGELPWLR
jgi:RNA polymerase sigma-70 factor (ECF subfamily)